MTSPSNITLTALNSVLAILTLPLIANLAISRFLDEGDRIGLRLDKMLQIFAVVLVPVLIGMLVRHRSSDFAARMDRPVRIASAVLLLLVVLGAMLGERDNIAGYLADVGLIAAMFCVLSLSIGSAVPRLLGPGEPQAVASGIEIGIPSSTLAIAMAITVLESTRVSVPPAVHGIVRFPIAALFGLVVRRRARIGAGSSEKHSSRPRARHRATSASRSNPVETHNCF